ncbi:MAG: AMP-binding protein [Pseudomonadota bacterium]
MPKNYNAWPEGWPKSLNYPELPVTACLDLTAARVPNRIAVHFGGLQLTFSELKSLSERFAAALDDLGVKKGDRVGIHLINCPQFVIAYYGALRIGAVFTPLSPLLSAREAKHQLNDSGAETLISLDLIYPGIQPILAETPVKTVITTSIADCYNSLIAPLKPLGKIPVPDTLDLAPLLAKHQPFAKTVDIDVKRDLAHLAYTGGTTGVSKGVMLTHFNVLANALQFSLWFSGAQIDYIDGVIKESFPPGVGPEDRLAQRDKGVSLVVVPWFHAMGTVGYLNGQILAGNTMAVFPRFDATEYLDAIEKFGANMLGGAPQLYIPLINHPNFKKYNLSGVQVAASGAAPLPRTVMDGLLGAFSGVVCEAYGLTECTMGATANPPDRDKIRVGSVGLPVFDTELKTIDALSGADLPPGQEGEICIKGPQVMQGYWNRPEATADVLKDGWLLTGDIGREDEDGYFYITDRKKDLILYKGYNVYPRELEEVLFEHPAVEQCAVVGKPDETAGEIPIAFVQLKKGAQAGKDELLAHINNQVAHYKKIRDLFFLDAIPVSAAGKVLRKELRDKVRQG